MRKKLVGIILVLLFIPLCLPETSLGEVKRESSILDGINQTVGYVVLEMEE